MDSPKRQRSTAGPVGPVMTYGTDFREAYVQTRHKNLRCFPVCCAMHMEKSFCGRTIEVSAAFPRDTEIPKGRPTVVGEFRCTSVAPSFSLGGKTNVNDIRSSRFIFGELAMSDPWDLRFVINPNRKWFYPRTTSEGEMHVYTVYLFIDDTLIGMLDSPSFKVLPIWKEERRPSMSNLLAVPKQASSGSGEGSQISDEYTSPSPNPNGAVYMPRDVGPPVQLTLQQHQMMEAQRMGYPGLIPVPTTGPISWAATGGMPMVVHPVQPPPFYAGSGPPVMHPPGAMYLNMPQPYRHQFSPVSSPLPPSPSPSSHTMYPPYFTSMPSLAIPQMPQMPQMQQAPPTLTTAGLPHFAPPSVRPFSQRFPPFPSNMLSPAGSGKPPSAGLGFQDPGQIEGPVDGMRNRHLKRPGGI